MTSSLLEPLERHSLAEQAVRSLKRLILAEGLKPGSRLPSERQLAETLGISRNVVRETFRFPRPVSSEPHRTRGYPTHREFNLHLPLNHMLYGTEK